MKKTFEHYEEQEIKDLLMFRKVTKVNDDTIELDNGLVLNIIPNEGCGGCSSGWYSLTELNGCDNAITNVEFECDYEDDNDECSYTIFVYAENNKIKLLQVDGDDGNGYYGSGYKIRIIGVKNETIQG